MTLMRLPFLLRRAPIGSIVGLLFVVGCGDDERPPSPNLRDMDITFDAGDGGVIEMDGGDAGEDAAMPPVDGGTGICRVEGEVLTIARDEVDRSVRAPEVALSGSTFAIVWSDARGGVPDAFVYAWPATAPSGTEVRLTDDFSPTRDVRITDRPDGFTVGWVDTTAGSFEIFARVLTAAGAIEEPMKRITNNMLREDTVALARLSDGTSLLAWTESDGLGGPLSARAVPLDARGSAVGMAAQAALPPRQPTAPRIGALGSGAALGWTEAGTVYLQRLSAAGEAMGDATSVNVEGNATTTPSFAIGDMGGGVAFGVLVAGARQEIRMRTVDAMGLPNGPEAILTPPPARGTDPSIAPFATGFAVAYRTNDDGGFIRLAFATATGELSSTLDVAMTASTLGSGPSLVVGPDGRMVLAWLETDTVTATIRAARVVCS